MTDNLDEADQQMLMRENMARQAQKTAAIEDLRAGRQAKLRVHGNSMLPQIRSGQKVTLEPATASSVAVGDAVLCRVKGTIYVHKVMAKQADGRVLIGNAGGHANGWTKAVYGRVVSMED